jgi:hypothetical protein
VTSVLTPGATHRRRPQVLSLGGGLDSWAMLLDAEARGELPDVVAFVDVGDADAPAAHPGEWDGTYRHIAVVQPWCATRGIEFVEISARTGYLIRPENQAARSLFQWLWGHGPGPDDHRYRAGGGAFVKYSQKIARHARRC